MAVQVKSALLKPWNCWGWQIRCSACSSWIWISGKAGRFWKIRGSNISGNIKSGRLADLGFPPLDEAREIYSRINPATFTPGHSKVLLQTGEANPLPATFLIGTTFLERVILRMDSELFRMELNYLVNTALVADQAHLVDTEQMKSVVERVYGYLNIALEYLSQGEETKGAEILGGEYLKSLFQLGLVSCST